MADLPNLSNADSCKGQIIGAVAGKPQEEASSIDPIQLAKDLSKLNKEIEGHVKELIHKTETMYELSPTKETYDNLINLYAIKEN